MTSLGTQLLQSEDGSQTATILPVAATSLPIVHKNYLNTQVAIARLPPEILAQVFLHCIVPVAIGGYACPPSHKWLKVSHVCHFWREVALGTPGLWTHIHVRGLATTLECANAFLDRSRQSMLTLRVDFVAWKLSPVIHALIRSMVRADNLHLYLPITTMKEIGRLLPHFAPHLRSLYLGIDCDLYRGDESYDTSQFLRACSAPALQELKISNVHFEGLKGTLPFTLKHLSIYNPGRGPSESLSVLLGILQGLCSLESLAISSDMYSALPSIPSSSIHMPHLKFLRVDTSTEECVHLLALLVIPASTIVSVSSRTRVQDDDGILLASVLVDKLMACVQHICRENMTAKLVLSRTHLRVFQTDRSDHEARSVESWQSPQFDVAFIGPNGNIPCSWFADVCTLASPLDVGILFISDGRLLDCSPTLSPEHNSAWHEVLRSMPNLFFLGINNRVMSGRIKDDHAVLELIRPYRSSSPDDIGATSTSEFRIPVPKLEHLLLQDVTFKAAKSSRGPRFVDELMDVFQQRKEAGCELKQIIIRKCVNVEKRNVKKLRKVVAVAWDEVDEQ
ncbi:hypothetical protein EIP91_002243 [Steccherinum ochraceum]|uniref:F-box domain-containing protein n=1 Tax=Steccherinum ochraceum TaxID=92696 RepID=A0A4R0RKZ6_9APHY|nr:hypothetical protein EIP91_002243 [Steccherinum ochraceum]